MKPQSAARERRIAEFSSRLGLAGSEELCKAFDQSVEFAALEGKSIAEAIEEFLHDDWGSQELRSLLGNASLGNHQISLPVMPKAAMRLLQTSDETTSAVELERIAMADQVLAARLLGVANSALHGARFEVRGIGEAVLRLGVPETRRVLLSACLGQLFASGPLQNLWEHSQQAAAAASRLALECGVDPETAFAAGLLHDIGRLGFARYPAETRVAERRWLEAGFPIVYAETLVYGEDHAAFGAKLLSRWEVSAEIVQAVAFHHRPECSDARLHSVLFLAEDVASVEPEDLWFDLRHANACERAGLDPEQIRLNHSRTIAQNTAGRACA